MSGKRCECGRPAEPDGWQCEKCSAPAGRVLAVLAMVLMFVTGCAENWTYDIKSMHHDKESGRHYVVCKSGFTETFIEIEVTPEVYNLVKVDDTCPAPMSIPQSTQATTVTPSSTPTTAASTSKEGS